MTSNRPYLLRAINEWILDNGMTPYLLVDTSTEDICVPVDYIKNNQIILNIHPDAVHHLVMDNKAVSFNARFDGKSQQIHVPVNSITAIYAKESGKGLVFPDIQENGDDKDKSNTDKNSRPHLKVIK